MLRCEAKLGLIRKLEILTHLKQFYVEDFEHLHIAVTKIEFNFFLGLR